MATFHCDQNIPRALAEELRQRRHTVVRAVELQMAMADDPAHLLRAARDGRILLTKDKDFVDLHIAWFLWAADWGVVPRAHAGIIIIDDNWPSIRAAQEVETFLRHGWQLVNTCWHWDPTQQLWIAT